jgi:hypothetical protein
MATQRLLAEYLSNRADPDAPYTVPESLYLAVTAAEPRPDVFFGDAHLCLKQMAEQSSPIGLLPTPALYYYKVRGPDYGGVPHALVADTRVLEISEDRAQCNYLRGFRDLLLSGALLERVRTVLGVTDEIADTIDAKDLAEEIEEVTEELYDASIFLKYQPARWDTILRQLHALVDARALVRSLMSARLAQLRVLFPLQNFYFPAPLDYLHLAANGTPLPPAADDRGPVLLPEWNMVLASMECILPHELVMMRNCGYGFTDPRDERATRGPTIRGHTEQAARGEGGLPFLPQEPTAEPIPDNFARGYAVQALPRRELKPELMPIKYAVWEELRFAPNQSFRCTRPVLASLRVFGSLWHNDAIWHLPLIKMQPDRVRVVLNANTGDDTASIKSLARVVVIQCALTDPATFARILKLISLVPHHNYLFADHTADLLLYDPDDAVALHTRQDFETAPMMIYAARERLAAVPEF